MQYTQNLRGEHRPQVYRKAWELYEQHSGSASSNEWPNLRWDLTELAAPSSLRQKMRVTKRMARVYTIFQL